MLDRVTADIKIANDPCLVTLYQVNSKVYFVKISRQLNGNGLLPSRSVSCSEIYYLPLASQSLPGLWVGSGSRIPAEEIPAGCGYDENAIVPP